MTDQKNKQPQQPQQGHKPNRGAKTAMPDPDEDPVTEADFDDDQPGKRIQIDDNPDETKKKIPNMQKRH